MKTIVNYDIAGNVVGYSVEKVSIDTTAAKEAATKAAKTTSIVAKTIFSMGKKAFADVKANSEAVAEAFKVAYAEEKEKAATK